MQAQKKEACKERAALGVICEEQSGVLMIHFFLDFRTKVLYDKNNGRHRVRFHGCLFLLPGGGGGSLPHCPVLNAH
jgi:hypothetical protein